MCGYIKIYRDVRNHWIYQNAEYYRWWCDLLFEANYKDSDCLSGNKVITVKRGELVAGINSLMRQWGRSKTKIITFLKMLESEQMITRRVDNLLPIITICNYDSYQGGMDNLLDKPMDKPMDNLLDTSKERKESKEIYINNLTTRTREEVVTWDAVREQGYFNTFKGQGSAIPFSKRVGKTPQEVMMLAEVYMATRQLKDKGHKDYKEFVNLFLWHVENNKISIPVQPKAEKKVISGKEVLNVYG